MSDTESRPWHESDSPMEALYQWALRTFVKKPVVPAEPPAEVPSAPSGT